VELMRAVIVSAAQDERLLKDTMATSLVPRILAYVRHHLTEADLEPARIAATHNISTRSPSSCSWPTGPALTSPRSTPGTCP
jgi:hypothetical protein